jgi:hypothetical protein
MLSGPRGKTNLIFLGTESWGVDPLGSTARGLAPPPRFVTVA